MNTWFRPDSRVALWRARVGVVRCLCATWCLLFALCGQAQTLRWSSQADMQTFDPHAQNDALTNSMNAHVYERLTARDEKLALMPGLAERWQQVDALTWRFYLRRGVKFHDGSAFDADDVVFSVQRAQHRHSAVAQYAKALGVVSRLDAHTVEFKLAKPNPVLLDQVDAIFIMSKAWAMANGAGTPLALRDKQEGHAANHANGTGSFVLVSRQRDVCTVFRRNPNYWAVVPGNVLDMEHLPIGSAASRAAALLTGAVDLVLDPSPQDHARLEATPGIKLLRGVENRVVFLGFDQNRDELLYSNIKGRNPLKDLRVRQAFAHAIDMPSIRSQVMRGQSVVTACLAPSALACEAMPQLDATRAPFDPSRSRQLLEQAGYADGFELTLDCPVNRHPTDEALCMAIASMLAKVQIKTQVRMTPRAQYFAKLEKLDTSFYLLGWGGAELDPQPTMEPLMHSFDAQSSKGDDNYGRFANAALDVLIDQSATETDAPKRALLLRQAMELHHAQLHHLVLHRQMLTWAMRSHVEAVHAANNHMRAWLVRLKTPPPVQ
jgi:peptide/nickel transport system substrate-binding protein